MAGKDSPQKVIDSYRKQQKIMPFVFGGLAVVLVVVGIVMLVMWLGGSERSLTNLFASATPTPTLTYTASPIPPTETPTLTPIPTETLTPTVTLTPSGPFEYTVLEKDNCWDIAAKFNVNVEVLLAINSFPANQCPITPGMKILIPTADQTLPTSTPWVISSIPRGQVVEYSVERNDTLAIIASKFNSTVDEIVALNKLANSNTIYIGQILKVKVNLVTPTKTLGPTSTPAPTKTSGTVQPTVAGAAATATVQPVTANSAATPTVQPTQAPAASSTPAS